MLIGAEYTTVTPDGDHQPEDYGYTHNKINNAGYVYNANRMRKPILHDTYKEDGSPRPPTT